MTDKGRRRRLASGKSGCSGPLDKNGSIRSECRACGRCVAQLFSRIEANNASGPLARQLAKQLEFSAAV